MMIFYIRKISGFCSDEKGVTLLEVLLSTVVLGIALTGFLMALSTATQTSVVAVDENKLVYLAQLEFEQLRATDFDRIAFVQTSDPGHLQDVPDYFQDIAISTLYGGAVNVMASGDLADPSYEFSRERAFDGKRANFLSRWMGSLNDLAWIDTGGEPSAGGGSGGGPGAGGPGGEPGAGGNFRPDNYQYVLAAFPSLTRISRILYDNRFNVSEDPDALPGDFDYFSHNEDVWQRNFKFFFSTHVPGSGEVFDPWLNDVVILESVSDQRYGSSGISVIWDNAESPLLAGIVGVTGIDTYSDFDINFHWPYVSEIEMYGFSEATYYVDKWRAEDTDPWQYDNLIMYFPNYLDSGFDMGRRTWVEVTSDENAITDKRDLINVEIEFYPNDQANRELEWQKVTWWQEDFNELARFQTSFYSNGTTRIDMLPDLDDFPSHRVYEDNEDLDFAYTVPGATEIRMRFSEFDLDPAPGTDFVTIEDKDGTIYDGPAEGVVLANRWTPWIPGNTIVVHFVSDAAGNSTDAGWGGFEVDAVQVRSYDF